MDKLKIDGNGRLPVPNVVARELGGAELKITSFSGSHLLCSACDGREPVVFSGMLGEVCVADLLSFFNMFRKTGVLCFELEGGRKDLYFQKGEVVFASSSFAEEDLGEILFELGKVDRDSLNQARQFASARSPLGRILVEKKVVSAKDLWHAARLQVEKIVYTLFRFHQGGFFFKALELEKEHIVRLSMSTQNLIMEGLRRIDERELFMRRIPSFDVVVVPTGKEGEGLTGGEEQLLAYAAEGVRSVREVVRVCGAGEFDGLRMLYQLAERGLIGFDEAPVLEPQGRLGQIATICNGALSTLFRRIRGGNPQYGEALRRFLREIPQPYSFVLCDAELKEDGSIDAGRILANLEGLAEGDKEKLLADTFNEIIYMECMTARRELGATESADLIERVQEVSQRVMNLVGRKQ